MVDLHVSKFRSTMAAVALLVTATAAHAQSFAGYSQGCFSTSACTPSSASDNVSHLSFTGIGTAGSPSSFGTASGGSLPLTNLGSLSLANGTHTYTGVFDILLTFTMPGGSGTFGATIGGSVTGNSGMVTVNFDNTPKHIIYSGGSFDLVVNDLSVTTGNTAKITGQITNSQQGVVVAAVPEPATLALLGSGVIGLVGFARRRNRV